MINHLKKSTLIITITMYKDTLLHFHIWIILMTQLFLLLNKKTNMTVELNERVKFHSIMKPNSIRILQYVKNGIQ